jgi:hypothetical protein
VRPSRAIWTAWTLALVGGLAVLVAAGLVLNDPCAGGAPCTSTSVSVATALALAGTAIAVVGGLVATYLTIRRSEADQTRPLDPTG